MSFLSGLGKGLHRAFDANNLAITQAILAGDYQGATALRARQAELQRRNDARDAQVVGAKNLGIGNDEISTLSPEDLSWLARQRIAARQHDAGASPPAREGEGAGVAAAGTNVKSPQQRMFDDPEGRGTGGDIGPPPDAALDKRAFPGTMPGAFDPRTMNDLVARMPYKDALALLGRGALPGFGGSAAGAMPPLPRASTPGHAAALPKGSPFIAPDGSIRKAI
jgi:hypothetical protein